MKIKKWEETIWKTITTEGCKTYFVALGQFLTDKKLFNGTTKMQSCIVIKNHLVYMKSHGFRVNL